LGVFFFITFAGFPAANEYGGIDFVLSFIRKRISSEKGVSKPDPRLIEIALAECGCTDKAEAVMVGDSATADIPAAVNAGIDSIFVDWKNTGCQQATYTAKNLAEVEQILLKS